MTISIHTDHVNLSNISHILELIETLSNDVKLNFSLMFNPDKRELVHEIYDTIFKYREKCPFTMSVMTLRDIEDNGNIKTVKAGNRDVELAEGLFKFKGIYCTANTGIIHINDDGQYKGIVCGDDRWDYNIYEKDSFLAIRDKLIKVVKCTRANCGCGANYHVPKFASEEEANKYLQFAQKRQAQLFDEYLSTIKK